MVYRGTSIRKHRFTFSSSAVRQANTLRVLIYERGGLQGRPRRSPGNCPTPGLRRCP